MRLLHAVLLASVLSSAASGQTYTIATFAGGALPANVPGTSASLGSAPQYIATDQAGNVFFTDQNSVLRLDATSGILTLVAGNGTPGFSGDTGPATSAQLANPQGIALDSAGNLYIADSNNQCIRKVANGVITTVAGNGTPGYSGDNGPATSAQLHGPTAVAVDSAGNLYIADTHNQCIRKVSNGVIATVAGNGARGFSGDTGPATSALLNNPYGLAVDSAGNLYIADSSNNRIRKVSGGVISTVAGNGTPGFSGDNGLATSAHLAYPQDVAVDSAGALYIADTTNNRIRKVVNGTIATVAGPTVAVAKTYGFSGDNGPATSALLNNPLGLAVDAAGNLYIADSSNNRVRKVSNGRITTVAGDGTVGFSGDNGPATSAQLAYPWGVAVDSAGSLYIADYGTNRIRRVSNGVIATVAGNGTLGFSGDNGPAASAQFYDPAGLAADALGNLYIADYGNNRIRKLSGGTITTVAGGGASLGDYGPATSAQLNLPYGVAVDSAGNLYVADSGNNRIRKLSNGVISTVAGNGTRGFSGDNGPATSAQLAAPEGIAVDSAGNLYIGDSGNHRVRKVSNGVIATVAGNGTAGFSGDYSRATSAQLNLPYGVAVDPAGNLYIGDSGNNLIRKVSNGIIATVAGNGTFGFSGDNGLATSAQLATPYGVAIDSAGNLYIGDSSNSRVRVSAPLHAIKSVVNAASYIGGPVSPGELVTLFGTALGPATAASAYTLPSTGKLATAIGGVRVLFNGIPAPMIYASSTQVSAVVPYEMAAISNPSVWIEYEGDISNAVQLSVAATAPGLFTADSSGSGPGAILNQDNSLNRPGNPAAKGSIVQMFLTGEGQTDPPGVTGAITTATLPPPQVTPAPLPPILVLIDGHLALYAYAGEAPGQVAGVMQLNVPIPLNARPGALSIQVWIGPRSTQNGVTVSVQ